MIRHSYIASLALALAGLTAGCSEQPRTTGSTTPSASMTSTTTPALGRDRYVLMTYIPQVVPAGPLKGRTSYTSYISYSDTLPQGQALNNILQDNTLIGRYGAGGGGLLEGGGRLYRFANNANQQTQTELLTNTPVRLLLSSKGGAIEQRAYLEDRRTGFSQAPKNFVVGSDRGFLVMPPARDESYSIQLFDPESFAPLLEQILVNNADREQMRQFVLEKTPSLKGQTLPLVVLGQQLMVLHGGALIMDLSLQTAQGNRISRDSYLVAYEAKSGGRLLSLSYLPNTGRLGSASELLQYSHDERGDLYLMTQGGDPQGFYQNALIYRIRKGATEVDPSWSYGISELVSDRPARFHGILAHGGKLLTLVNIAALTESSALVPPNLWQYYLIDIASRSAQPLPGLQPSSAPLLGVNLGLALGDELYLRYVRTGSDAPYNGYYSYEPKSGRLRPAFSVSLQSGYVADLKHITLPADR